MCGIISVAAKKGSHYSQSDNLHEPSKIMHLTALHWGAYSVGLEHPFPQGSL